MGCWNHTCFLSNLSIGAGTDVALMTLVHTDPGMGSCRPTEHYYPAPVMIYGKYDDYGGVENCHGSEIDYLLNEFKSNQTIKDSVDIEEFTRLGDQGSLHFIHRNVGSFHKSLKGEDNPQISVQHVVVDMHILNALLEHYYFTDYHILKDPEKNAGEDNYVPINYEYLCNLIPAYIKELKEYYAKDAKGVAESKKAGLIPISNLHFDPVPNLDWKNPDILGRWLHSFSKDVGVDFFKRSYLDRIKTLAEANKDEELTSCLQEFCKYSMIYSYMNFSRRVYIRPQCSSQETDPIAHRIMSEITLAEIERQRIEWEEEDFPDDAWDPKREVFMEQCKIEF